LGATTAPIIARPRRRPADAPFDVDARGTAALAGPDASSVGSAGPAAPSGSTAPRLDRSEAGSHEARSIGALAFTNTDRVVLPPEHGALDRGRGLALLAHELTHVSQQRRLGNALPEEESGPGRELEREARLAERLVMAPGAPHGMATPAPLPLVASRPPAGIGPAEEVGLTGDAPRAAALARSIVRPGGDSASTGGSLESAGPGLGAGAMALTAQVQRQEAGAPVPAGGEAPAAGGELDVDDLARRLYDRIRDRLRRELLVDRERAGLLTDLR
jgi:hypothetical protein